MPFNLDILFKRTIQVFHKNKHNSNCTSILQQWPATFNIHMNGSITMKDHMNIHMVLYHNEIKAPFKLTAQNNSESLCIAWLLCKTYRFGFPSFLCHKSISGCGFESIHVGAHHRIWHITCL